MPRIESELSTTSATFVAQRQAMLTLLDEVRDIERRIRAHADKERAKFERRGQLVPRERVARLLDPGAPFVELSTLAGYRMHDDNGRNDVAGGGNVVGIGFVQGIRCLVSANDSAIKGGSIAPMGLEKSLRAQAIALENRLPVISLVESGGANLLYQSEIFVEGGRIFYNMARLSAAGIPQITVVHGSSTAGGAYMPGLSDWVIMVRDRARVFLAGPPLVKAALGEDADEEALGGAEMHATVTGSAEYLADDDGHAIEVARDLVSRLNWQRQPAQAPRPSRPPAYDPDELCGAIPVDLRTPYDPRELIARLIDASDWLEFKATFGADTVCGNAHVDGWPVGIIANAGPIMPQGSVKAAQFIQLCNQTATPIVFLQNTTGYMVGRDAEQAGAVKHGAKMIQAVANSRVPHITFIVGGGYGAGNYGMCGRAYAPRFIFAWPHSRVAVMGGEQAATVMKIITRAKFERQGMPLDEAALEKMAGGIRDRLEGEANALFATARLWDDGVIDPRDTRRLLGFLLATCAEGDARTLHPNSWGVARG